MGGVTTWTPVRPFVPAYVPSPLTSNDIIAIRAHYGLECDEKGNFSNHIHDNLFILLIIF